MIRLIALDIDGTLLTTDRRISPETHRALNRAHEQGCAVVLATGRAFRSLQNVMELLGCADYAITVECYDEDGDRQEVWISDYYYLKKRNSDLDVLIKCCE